MHTLSSKVLLPNNIIIEILLRLPAKTVYQFRYVCKNWLSWISEPEFIKKHLQRHSTTTTDDHGRNINPSSLLIITRCTRSKKCGLYERLIQGKSNNASIFSVDYNFIDDDNANRVVEIMNVPPPIKSAAGSTGFMCLGSCNGLLGFWSQTTKKDVIYLWNPCTEECKKIIPPTQPNKSYDTTTTTTTRTAWKMNHTTYGFGYDPITSEYKILANTCYFCVTNDGRTTRGTLVHWKTVANIYTLGTNSWRSIGEYPFRLLVQNQNPEASGGLLVGGALYWRARKSVSSVDTIVCFDLAVEEYREIPIPKSISHRHGGSGPISYLVELDLKEYKGRLSIFRNEKLHENTVEVWVINKTDVDSMNVEEDGTGSWSKLFTISDVQLVALYQNKKYTRLEPGIGKEDEFLMVIEPLGLYLYNPTTNGKNSTRRILDDSTHGEFGCNIFTSVLTYTESLAFLNPPNTRLTGQKCEDEQQRIKVQNGKSKTRRLRHAVAKVAKVANCFI